MSESQKGSTSLSPCCKETSHKFNQHSGFQRTQYLWQLTEVPRADVPTDTMVGVLYVGSHKMEGVRCCQERKEFVLLGLIIQDLGFWFPRAKHR